MKAVLLICCAMLLTGCSTHYLTKEMFMEQIKEEEKLILEPTGMNLPILPLIKASYTGNQITEIYCVNDKGEKVTIGADRNSMLIVMDKQGQTFRFYLDTVCINRDKIRALRSKVGWCRERGGLGQYRDNGSI